MNKLLGLSFVHPVVMSTIVLILALGLTRLSFACQAYEPVNISNQCGVDQDEPCIVSVRNAGFPLPYLLDQIGISAMGALGFEDFLIVSFLLDLLFYALVIGGMCFLVGRKHSWLPWIPMAIALGVLAAFVLRSAASDPAVGTEAVYSGIMLGGLGALLAILGTLLFWHDTDLALFLWKETDIPFGRTLRKFGMMLALPGLVCGWFAGALFGTIL